MKRPTRPVGTKRRRLLVAVTILAALVVALAVVWQPSRDAPDGLAGSAAVTASSTAIGSSPRNVVDRDSATPVAGWVSNETVGAWVNLHWPQPHDLHQVVIGRNKLSAAGITAGFLSFGDGSHLQVELSTTSTRTVVPITPRMVDSVRFTVSTVSPGARSVTLVQLAVADQPGDLNVATGPTPGGNAAPGATVSQRPDSGSSDAATLVDGSGEGGPAPTGQPWTATRPQGAWVQLTWGAPQELASIEVIGAAGSAATLASATATFDDGSELPLGAVLSDPQHPTLVGFMPRVTSTLRITIDRVSGSGPMALAELRAYQAGSTPARPARISTPKSPKSPQEATAECARGGRPSQDVGLSVRCPVTGATVDDQASVEVSTAPGYSLVTAVAWPADPAAPVGTTASVVPAADGSATVTVDLRTIAAGPLTVELVATGTSPTRTVFFQLYRRGGAAGSAASSDAARGRTLIYADEFDRPLSATRTGAGADYAAAKPTTSGVEDFGDAIFADPALSLENVGIADDRYLRLKAAPMPAGFSDPQGWGRTHLGGLLASARPGGSGVAAQYGYFEARMLAPAVPGAWPAFWMLPTTNLVAAQPVVAEIDAVELYGHEPTGACHSTHEYQDGKDRGVARCGRRFPTERAALAWHTYGVSITPDGNTFFIDGAEVARSPQVQGGNAPMFFLLDLALGGGWPVKLESVQDRAELYVDYVRVYV